MCSPSLNPTHLPMPSLLPNTFGVGSWHCPSVQSCFDPREKANPGWTKYLSLNSLNFGHSLSWSTEKWGHMKVSGRVAKMQWRQRSVFREYEWTKPSMHAQSPLWGQTVFTVLEFNELFYMLLFFLWFECLLELTQLSFSSLSPTPPSKPCLQKQNKTTTLTKIGLKASKLPFYKQKKTVEHLSILLFL